MKKREKVPISRNAENLLILSASRFIALLALAVILATTAHYAADKIIYDGFYPLQVVTEYVDRHEEYDSTWYDDYISSHFDPQRGESIFIARNADSYGARNKFGASFEEKTLTEPDGYKYKNRIYYHRHGLKKFYGEHVVGLVNNAHGFAHEDKLLPGKERFFFTYEVYFFVALLSLTPLGPGSWLRRRKEILAANELDFEMMKKLSFLRTEDPFSAEEGSAEPALPGSWRPVAREFGPAQKIFSDGYGRTVDTVPDFTQLSGIIWFTNGKQTIEVHFRSENAIRHLLASAVKEWTGSKGPTNVATHVGHALEEFQFFRGPIRPRPVLADVVADLDKSIAERSEIEIRGSEAAPGIFIATSLGREGKQQIVLPTGFLRRALAEVKSVTGAALPAPDPRRLLAA